VPQAEVAHALRCVRGSIAATRCEFDVTLDDPSHLVEHFGDALLDLRTVLRGAQPVKGWDAFLSIELWSGALWLVCWIDMDESVQVAQFWFDPLCPWAWITSRWMLEVERVRPVRTEWRMMSLTYLNLVQHEDTDWPADYVERLMRGWGPIRVCAAAAHHAGDDILGPIYTAIGTRYHVEGRWEDPNVLGDAVDEVGLPRSLADAVDSDDFDETIKRSHNEVFQDVGLDVGTPAIRVLGNAFFGPVVSPAPKGEAAGLLWDGFVLVTNTDGFFEIKRSRDRQPSFD